MIPKEILRRLTMLEAELRSYQPAKSHLAMALVAYHVGRWQSHESVAEAATRALGYETLQEFKNDLRNDLDAINARCQSAIATMFELEKVDVKNSPRDVVCEAISGLLDAAEKGGMPLPDI